MESENKSNKAGVIALIVSFIIPILGVIIYLIKRKEVVNAVSYLYAAAAGVIVGLLIGLL